MDPILMKLLTSVGLTANATVINYWEPCTIETPWLMCVTENAQTLRLHIPFILFLKTGGYIGGSSVLIISQLANFVSSFWDSEFEDMWGREGDPPKPGRKVYVCHRHTIWRCVHLLMLLADTVLNALVSDAIDEQITGNFLISTRRSCSEFVCSTVASKLITPGITLSPTCKGEHLEASLKIKQCSGWFQLLPTQVSTSQQNTWENKCRKTSSVKIIVTRLALPQWWRGGSVCVCVCVCACVCKHVCMRVCVSAGGSRPVCGVSQSLHKQQQVHIMLGRKLLQSRANRVAPLEPAAPRAAKQINQQEGTWQPRHGGRARPGGAGDRVRCFLFK